MSQRVLLIVESHLDSVRSESVRQEIDLRVNLYRLKQFLTSFMFSAIPLWTKTKNRKDQYNNNDNNDNNSNSNNVIEPTK